MNIRFTSTLTPDDENQLAPAVLQALSVLLDLLPIAYVLQIETSDLRTYQHGGVGRSLIPQESTLEASANPATFES